MERGEALAQAGDGRHIGEEYPAADCLSPLVMKDVSMVRTQFSLEPEEVSWLKRQAKRCGTSVAGVIRNLIRAAENGTPTTDRVRAKRRARAQLRKRFAFVACIKDGPETDASLAEEYLHGEGDVR